MGADKKGLAGGEAQIRPWKRGVGLRRMRKGHAGIKSPAGQCNRDVKVVGAVWAEADTALAPSIRKRIICNIFERFTGTGDLVSALPGRYLGPGGNCTQEGPLRFGLPSKSISVSLVA